MSNRNKMDYTKKFNPMKTKEVVESEIETVEEPEIEIVEEIEQPEVITKKGIVAIKKSQTLNLREDMSKDANIVKQLNSGESVIIDNEYHDWYHVVTESGAEGYVMSKFIEIL